MKNVEKILLIIQFFSREELGKFSPEKSWAKLRFKGYHLLLKLGEFNSVELKLKFLK